MTSSSAGVKDSWVIVLASWAFCMPVSNAMVRHLQSCSREINHQKKQHKCFFLQTSCHFLSLRRCVLTAPNKPANASLEDKIYIFLPVPRLSYKACQEKAQPEADKWINGTDDPKRRRNGPRGLIQHTTNDCNDDDEEDSHHGSHLYVQIHTK